MNKEKDLLFTRDHEWLRKEGDTVFVGITDYAQHALGDIVFVELPETGKVLSAGDVLGVVESVKAASDVYSPISGTVVNTNGILEDDPGSINTDPYGSWIAEIRPDNPQEMDNLMNADEYKDFCEKEE
jgi:glycine cleavage system H protein